MRARTLLLAFCLLLGGDLPVLSKGSAVHKEDPWDPHHIDNLPTEVRHYIASICRDRPAPSDFATYSPHEKRWRNNLEYPAAPSS